MKMTAATIERLLTTYEEVCKETGLRISAEGYRFFKEVMFADYVQYCERAKVEPSWKAFKVNCIHIAKEMMNESLRASA